VHNDGQESQTGRKPFFFSRQNSLFGNLALLISVHHATSTRCYHTRRRCVSMTATPCYSRFSLAGLWKSTERLLEGLSCATACYPSGLSLIRSSSSLLLVLVTLNASVCSHSSLICQLLFINQSSNRENRPPPEVGRSLTNASLSLPCSVRDYHGCFRALRKHVILLGERKATLGVFEKHKDYLKLDSDVCCLTPGRISPLNCPRSLFWPSFHTSSIAF